MQETRFNPAVPPRFNSTPGYRLIHEDRKYKKGGGVAILVHDSLDVCRFPRQQIVNTDSKLETLWARVSVGHNKGVLFCSLYRPPSGAGSQLTADLDQLDSELEFMLSRHRGVVMVCGDANCDWRYLAGNTSGAQFKSLLEKYDLSQLNAAPTFDTGSILDVIVTNSPESVVAHDVAHCHFSRHRFTRALIRVKKCRPEPLYREHRSWNSIDFDSFCDDLAGTDWSPVFATDSTETQSDYVIQKLTTVLDEHAPVKRVRARNHRPPPLSEDTKRLMASRRAALRGPDRAVYSELNRQVKSAVQRDTRGCLERRIEEAGPNSMYRCIRPVILSKSAGSGHQLPTIGCDALNRYFADIGVSTAASVAASLPTNGVSPLPVRLPRVVTGEFRVQPVTPEELTATVRCMNGSRSMGPDGIPMYFLKRCFDMICHVILCLVNTSLVTGTVPDSWKMAFIQPIYKGSGSLSDPSSFRPISLVPCLGKITERVVFNQLSGYLDSCRIMSDAQHGFRRFHSTETCLLAVTDCVLEAMDRREISPFGSFGSQ